MRSKLRKRWAAISFILPALILHGIVVFGPSVASISFAFTKWSGIGSPVYIGLQNFIAIFTQDRVFRLALTNNIKWIIMFVPVSLLLGLVAALLIRNVTRGKVFRILLFLPPTIATVVVVRIWQSIYHPFAGINNVLEKFELNFMTQLWLGDPNVVMYSIATAGIWQYWGLVMVIFLSGLQQIDYTLYEAARIDGANKYQLFRHITLPLLRPTLVFIFVLTLIWSWGVFDIIYVMTQAGPGHASEVITTWIYTKAFYTFEAGYACALASTLVVFASTAVVLFVYLRRKGWEEVA